MENDDFIQEMEALYQRFVEADTNKFVDLMKIAPLDLKTDFINADLRGIDFTAANLSGANLSGANLSEVNLSGANLSEVNLSGANLNGANLNGANLNGANLKNIQMNKQTTIAEKWRLDREIVNINLENKRLSEVHLSEANLGASYLIGDDPNKADLRKPNLRIEVDRSLTKLMMLPEILVQNKFGPDRIGQLQTYINNYAIRQVLEERLRDLKGIAQTSLNATQKMLIKLTVLTVGSIVYSNIFRIYTASFGAFAWPLAIIGGFVASVLVDYLATEAFSRYLCRQITRQALNKLEVQKHQDLKEGKNQFGIGYWDRQIKFIHDIEGVILASSFEINFLGYKISIYVVFALLLNVVGFIGAFYLVNKSGLFDNLSLPIELVIASLPVLLTWMSAFAQADWFHRPKYARELLIKYREKTDGMIHESIDEIHKVLIRLEAGIKAMLNRQSEFPTVELAEISADIQYQETQIEEIQERVTVKVKSIKRKFERQKEEMEADYPEFQEDSQELTSEQIELSRQSYEAEKNRFLASYRKEIDNKQKEAIDEYINNLQSAIEELEVRRNIAMKQLNQKSKEFQRARRIG